jgi:flagellar transcriptional activator FlhC
MTTLVQNHVNALRVARVCLEWGARLHTTRQLTGLTRHTLRQLSDAPQDTATPARSSANDSFHWYLHQDPCGRIEACLFTAHFKRLRAQAVSPVDALLAAYRFLFEFTQGEPRLTFELAFDLASKADGRWAYVQSWLQSADCAECGCECITALKDMAFDCPFCDLLSGAHSKLSIFQGKNDE